MSGLDEGGNHVLIRERDERGLEASRQSRQQSKEQPWFRDLALDGTECRAITQINASASLFWRHFGVYSGDCNLLFVSLE